MIRATALCLTVVLTAFALPTARADEEEAPAAPRLAYEAAELAPAGGQVPWGLREVEPQAGEASGSLLGANLARVAKESGLPADALAVRTRVLATGDGQAAVVAYVDVRGKGVSAGSAAAFTAALERSAAQHAWRVSELGSRTHLLVVAAPAAFAEHVEDFHTGVAVHELCERATGAFQRALEERDQEAFLGSRDLLAAAARIEPSAGVVAGLQGMVALAVNNRRSAIGFFRDALADDARVPPKAPMAVRLAGELAQLLLLEGGDDEMAETLRVLQRAIAWEQHNVDAFWTFGNRYNLACVHARMGAKDNAFLALEGSLKLGKRILGAAYARNYDHARRVDTDMASLRDDPRFPAIMKTYAPEAVDPKP